MPDPTKVLMTEGLQRRGAVTNLDLSPYIAIIAGVREPGAVGGVLMPGEDERQRTEKRRMLLAAKESDYAKTRRGR